MIQPMTEVLQIQHTVILAGRLESRSKERVIAVKDERERLRAVATRIHLIVSNYYLIDIDGREDARRPRSLVVDKWGTAMDRVELGNLVSSLLQLIVLKQLVLSLLVLGLIFN